MALLILERREKEGRQMYMKCLVALALIALHATFSDNLQKPGCWLASMDVTLSPHREHPTR